MLNVFQHLLINLKYVNEERGVVLRVFTLYPRHCHAAAFRIRTSMGAWAVAQSPILVTTITLERLRQRGYESMLSLYEKIAPHLNEPLYTRSAWPALSKAKGYSGVRGGS